MAKSKLYYQALKIPATTQRVGRGVGYNKVMQGAVSVTNMEMMSDDMMMHAWS